MSAEPVGQHRHIQALQVSPQFLVAEAVVNPQIDLRARSRAREIAGQVPVMPETIRVEHIVVDIDLQLAAGQCRDDLGQRPDDR
jgi:hypothetical protein